MKQIIILTLLALTISSCLNHDSKKEQKSKILAAPIVSNKYEILSEEQSETSNKSQLLEYALYKDSIYTKDALERTVMEIFNVNRNKNVFNSHDGPTVVGVYLFTSKNAFKDKSEWIAMLSKGPNDVQPRVSFNNFKLTALSNQNDNVKSRDEIELEKLNSYLKKRGLDLCTLYETIKKIELDNIHKADTKYPDYGEKHMAMIEQLDKQFYKSLMNKYKLNDDMLSKVSIFAMSYCK